MRSVRLIAFVAACIAAPAMLLAQSAATRPASPAAAEHRSAPAEQVLRQRLREFSIEGVPFKDALAMLAESSGANLFVKWKHIEPLGIDPATPISLQVRDTTFAKALSLVLDSVGSDQVHLAYYVHDNVITITVSQSSRNDLTTRVYDITDLMYQIPDLSPNTNNGGGNSNTGTTGTSNASGNTGNGRR